jgi:hypothetical protein
MNRGRKLELGAIETPLLTLSRQRALILPALEFQAKSLCDPNI